MRYGKVVALITAAVTVFGAIAIIYEYNRYSKGIINFTVNNQKVSCNTIKDIKEYLENQVTYLDSIDISSYVTLEANTSTIDNLSFIDYIKLENNNIDINVDVSAIDFNGLEKELLKYNISKPISLNASIANNGALYEVKPESTGEQVDSQLIIQDLKNNKDLKDIEFKDYIIKPNITTEDLSDLVNKANKYITCTVEYSSGQRFTGDIHYVYIDNNKINVTYDEEFIRNIVKELEKVYDTAGKGFKFVDTNGNELEILGGTYGNIMNSAEEKEYLLELFSNAQSEYSRTPIMKQEMPEDLGDTYIEVDIQNQHMWHYVESVLCCETDIVTGDAYKRRDTPTGVYYISERINGKYLTGDTYRTWVNKWMRLTNTGIGLHDAGWRSRFGGNIYKGNGSHGCINLPKKYAYTLYEEVYTKMPVIVY